MAWPNPFYRRTENTRTCWDYTFELTPDHLTAEQAHPLKFSYDKLADECLDILDKLQPSPSKSKRDDPTTILPTQTPASDDKPPPKPPKRDLYLLLRDHHHDHLKLQELWDQATNIPSWVDWDQISRGQDVFYRYGSATLTGLAYQSLLGGMGANRVVEVLARTGGFNVSKARHRLFETTQMILECTRSLPSIQTQGSGFASCLRVRLLHAAVRRRILALTASRPSYYSVEDYGIPVNDLDCIATIGTFSATILWLALPRQGIFVRSNEVTDYIALWRLIAHYTGTPTDYFSSPARAKAMMESLLINEINPTSTSRVLAANIIRCLEATPPAYASRSFLEVNARWLNGHKLCDALGLGRPSPYYYFLMVGQCVFFMSICYLNRSIPYLDRKQIETLKKVFWMVIVEGKHGLGGEETVFDFKYIPDYHVGTEKAGDEQVGLKEDGIERRNLKTAIVAVGVMGLGCWIGLKVVGFGWWLSWKAASAIGRVVS